MKDHEEQRYVTVLSVLWALLGSGLAATVVRDSTDSGRPIVLGAAVVGVAASLAAAVSSARGRRRLAGACLMLSVIIPTSFAYVPNVLAFAAGLALVLWPSRGHTIRA